mgnify:FL=1
MKLDYKELLRKRKEVKIIQDDNRPLRKAMSDLTEEGIIFIPIGDKVYRRIELCTSDQVERYYRMQLSHLQTQYFNRIKPLEKHMRKELLDELHEGGLFNEA